MHCADQLQTLINIFTTLVQKWRQHFPTKTSHTSSKFHPRLHQQMLTNYFKCSHLWYSCLSVFVRRILLFEPGDQLLHRSFLLLCKSLFQALQLLSSLLEYLAIQLILLFSVLLLQFLLGFKHSKLFKILPTIIKSTFNDDKKLLFLTPDVIRLGIKFKISTIEM